VGGGGGCGGGGGGGGGGEEEEGRPATIYRDDSDDTQRGILKA